jgi:Kef-type K+ transport system membrane component KefB
MTLLLVQMTVVLLITLACGSISKKALGALNTRGLVELIVLNVAFNAGICTPQLFSMLVVMALVTTMMTVPLLNLLGIRAPVLKPS